MDVIRYGPGGDLDARSHPLDVISAVSEADVLDLRDPLSFPYEFIDPAELPLVLVEIPDGPTTQTLRQLLGPPLLHHLTPHDRVWGHLGPRRATALGILPHQLERNPEEALGRIDRIRLETDLSGLARTKRRRLSIAPLPELKQRHISETAALAVALAAEPSVAGSFSEPVLAYASFRDDTLGRLVPTRLEWAVDLPVWVHSFFEPPSGSRAPVETSSPCAGYGTVISLFGLAHRDRLRLRSTLRRLAGCTRPGGSLVIMDSLVPDVYGSRTSARDLEEAIMRATGGAAVLNDVITVRDPVLSSLGLQPATAVLSVGILGTPDTWA